jgi:hypothetical protein
LSTDQRRLALLRALSTPGEDRADWPLLAAAACGVSEATILRDASFLLIAPTKPSPAGTPVGTDTFCRPPGEAITQTTWAPPA